MLSQKQKQLNPAYIISLVAKIHEHSHEFLQKKLEQEGLSKISPSHGDILALLLRDGEKTMGELARGIRRSKNTVTVLVDKLIKLGYVTIQENKEDNRIKLIKLTSSGKKLEEPVKKISKELLKIAHSNFTELEKKALVKLLDKLLKNFEA